MELAKCKNCQNPVKTGKLYCSWRCANIVNNFKKIIRIIKICNFCGKEYKVRQSQSKISKYCSRKCKTTAENKQRREKALERFEMLSYPEPNTGCFIWLGVIDKQNRGYFTIDNKQILAHRFAFKLEFGYLPEEKVLHHICRQPLCVNPRHLLPVSPIEHYRLEPNMQLNAFKWQESGVKARREKQSCIHGHLYTNDNTYITPKGTRLCNICLKQTYKRYYCKKKLRNNIENTLIL